MLSVVWIVNARRLVRGGREVGRASLSDRPRSNETEQLFRAIDTDRVERSIFRDLAGALAGLGVMSWFFTASGVPERLAALERT